ncbi:MAG: acyl-[acyl-carrier-protein]--UDP-N-acetylglucosamine O-acyltransferase [Alphaproteobacteria bacterium]|nr:MAG: acyl-[acyl-carrier-protein]--UDP-N-acetylglucosamine O-acyltransferase [Alphaproteobacteria bacterium]
MQPQIHPSSVIADEVMLGAGVRIGPFCQIGAGVVLEDGVELRSHVVVAGNTRIGARTRIFPFASIGHEPQDLKYRGEPNSLVIGTDCIIREGVTMNPGTAGDRSETLVGHHCVFLANSHVAHDCVVGNHVIFSNNVMLAGHCKVGDHVIIGGGAGVHQFCRIGNNAFIGGLAGVENDVIPFGAALGNRAYLGGLNLVGMKRAGIARDSIHNARRAFKELFHAGVPVQQAVAQMEAALTADPVVARIVDFIRNSGDRALCTPRNGRDG